MQKAHENIDWENKPSNKTPINEYNLNKMDKSIDIIDDRVISLDTTKFNKTDASKLIEDFSLNTFNGVITVKYFDGSTKTFDTLLEKIAVNFDFDETTQQIVITLDDGTKKYIDLSAFIKPNEFLDSETVVFNISGQNVSASIKNGSITGGHLRTDYLADIRVESAKAEQSANQSENYADLSKSWAHGDTGAREDENTNNSKFWSEQSKTYRDDAEQLVKNSEGTLNEVNKKLGLAEFSVGDDGNLYYTDNSSYLFIVGDDGDLEWEVAS